MAEHPVINLSIKFLNVNRSKKRIAMAIVSQHFNILIKAGIFPDILKIGKVTPVFKRGNPELLGNYRPVSTLPIFGKIFEKIIKYIAESNSIVMLYLRTSSMKINLDSGNHTLDAMP